MKTCACPQGQKFERFVQRIHDYVTRPESWDPVIYLAYHRELGAHMQREADLLLGNEGHAHPKHSTPKMEDRAYVPLDDVMRWSVEARQPRRLAIWTSAVRQWMEWRWRSIGSECWKVTAREAQRRVNTQKMIGVTATDAIEIFPFIAKARQSALRRRAKAAATARWGKRPRKT